MLTNAFERALLFEILNYLLKLDLLLFSFNFFMQQREKSWFDSSLKSRLQYLGSTPGLPCEGEQQEQEFLDPSTGPVSTFCLLILDPDRVCVLFSLRVIW